MDRRARAGYMMGGGEDGSMMRVVFVSGWSVDFRRSARTWLSLSGSLC